MKVAIRVDASIEIGTGHFMRCLALAASMKEREFQVTFVSRDLPAHFSEMLKQKGINFFALNSKKTLENNDGLMHSHWLKVSQKEDAEDTFDLLGDQLWDWLIVDHYALDARWEMQLRATVKRIMVIDDLADRQHDCDILIDQNLYADMEGRYVGKVPTNCRLLLGPRYALLRHEFYEIRENAAIRTDVVKNILVFFGGADRENYTGRTIDALSELDLDALQVNVVIGLQHPYREKIMSMCVEYGYVCHVQTDKMAALIAAADIAIGAGGTAIWERCCLGLPSLCLCTAENQIKQVEDAARDGLIYAPAIGSDLVGAIKTHVKAFLENAFLRNFVSSRAMQAVDGRGILRVISNMDFEFEMRLANINDSSRLHEWRNHPSVSSQSRNQALIPWEVHQSWFAAVLESKDKLLLIAERDNVPIGVVRFDKRQDAVEISIYLVPDANHIGQGRNLLFSAEQWLMKNHPEVKSIQAHVLGSNHASQRLFSNANYQVTATSYSKIINN